MTAMHATTLSGLRLGDTAVVDGIGGVGILVVQAAAHAGARVIAIARLRGEAGARRRSTARPTACSSTQPDGYDDRRRARSASSRAAAGTDVFFELVGTTQTMNAGIRSLAKGGRFVSTGYTDQSIEIHPIEFILPETSFVSTVAATRLDLQDALELAAAGAMTVPDRRPVSDGRDPRRADGAAASAAVLGRQVLELA